jgi:hypothetical protein
VLGEKLKEAAEHVVPAYQVCNFKILTILVGYHESTRLAWSRKTDRALEVKSQCIKDLD